MVKRPTLDTGTGIMWQIITVKDLEDYCRQMPTYNYPKRNRTPVVCMCVCGLLFTSFSFLKTSWNSQIGDPSYEHISLRNLFHAMCVILESSGRSGLHVRILLLIDNAQESVSSVLLQFSFSSK
jgi:hypothetical protein